MAYGFNESTSTSGGSYLDEAGIFEAKLSEVVYQNARTDGSGKMVLAFRFETKDGRSFRHIEWEIDEAKSRTAANTVYDSLVKQGKAPKEPKAQFEQNFVDREFNNMGARIKHIAQAYGGGQGAINASSYQDFANKVVSSFKQLDTADYKHLLVVYNSKDYASLPRYAPFFTEDKASLEKKAAKEKMTKVVKDDDDGSFDAGSDAGDDQF